MDLPHGNSELKVADKHRAFDETRLITELKAIDVKGGL